jgi:hypothetical protein
MFAEKAHRQVGPASPDAMGLKDYDFGALFLLFGVVVINTR